MKNMHKTFLNIGIFLFFSNGSNSWCEIIQTSTNLRHAKGIIKDRTPALCLLHQIISPRMKKMQVKPDNISLNIAITHVICSAPFTSETEYSASSKIPDDV